MKKIIVHSTPAPIAKPTLRGGNAEIIVAAARLKPGEWFEWPDSPTTWRTTWRKGATQARLGSDVVAYRTADGRVVVRRKRDDEDFLDGHDDGAVDDTPQDDGAEDDGAEDDGAEDDAEDSAPEPSRRRATPIPRTR